MRTAGFGLRTAPKFSDGHQPTTSLNASDTRNVSRSRWPYLVWLSVGRCCHPCSAVTATRDVAWRATIDAGRLVPRESRIGTLDAHSCCVEVEHSLLEPVVDEQSIWRLSTPRPNWTIPFHPEPPKKGPGRGARRWRGPLASWVRAGLPRRWRSAPAPCRVPFGSSAGRADDEPHARSHIVCIPCPSAIFRRP